MAVNKALAIARETRSHMAEQKFGGNWTETKLARLQQYLVAYRTIFSSNPRAQYFTTWYVDAFAGTGSRSEPTASPGKKVTRLIEIEDVYDDADLKGYREGSASIALRLPDPFHKYLFIEKSKARADELEAVIKRDHPALFPRCTLRVGDANAVLREWCRQRDWKKERAVVFLDPYGMQVEWETIQTLGMTAAVDLWYLFPLGVGVSRLLTRSGNIDEQWKKRLTLLFGTTDWEAEFYRLDERQSLFGPLQTVERDAPAEKIQAFIEARLASCFAKVAKGLILKNSRNSPLYLLCFAAANKRGAPTALKIAQYILNESEPGRRGGN
jgi:three-Cys-motif partner protein